MNTPFEETDEFVRGHNGELLVARELQKRGWFIIPSYDYKGGESPTPRMQGTSQKYILPDLDCAKGGLRRWVEVKTKGSASLHKNTNRLDHGYSSNHHDNYLDVQKITGTEVFIAVYEIDTGEILMATLGSLDAIKRRAAMGGKPMVFFPRDAFKLFATIKTSTVGRAAPRGASNHATPSASE